MKLLRLVPKDTNISFMKVHIPAIFISIILVILSLIGFIFIGVNSGIDFKGGTNIEVRISKDSINISDVRSLFSNSNIGEVNIQEFGKPQDYIVSVQKQSDEEELEQSVVVIVKKILVDEFSGFVEFRRTETVGPVVSNQLKKDGAIALGAALIAMLMYIWFRFEWQFSIGAIIALTHDVILTIGFLVFTKLEFNLATIAAILTIIGYSMNDTVVVYDRIRENLRKYKKLSIFELLNLSVNNTLSRTILTSVTTLLALFALYIFGGANIAGFTLVMIWGVIIGTYSSVFIAGPLLMYLKIKQPNSAEIK
ncbi:MAG: protein translocase subunit SecF [Rhodospirillaceae bacterium]|nr:protein translocase subunit SecF [Rhodospirillaceae bacterium]|tara:strand:+ start:7176 stop:8102 length:927 start_codon:yes stop_codon:yes gene_type:complete